MSKKNKGVVLITGAAGRVGTILREKWGNRYPLRLADVKSIEKLESHEEYVKFEMTNPESCLDICSDVDTVIHLAADPGNGDFNTSLLPRNIIGPYNVFNAAASQKCKRLIFTSSIYAVRGHRPNLPPIEPSDPVYPQGIYGATKCWGEALARVIATEHNLSTIVVRLGNPSFNPNASYDSSEPSYLISPDDAALLFAHCVDADDIDFSIVHGSSSHNRMWLGMEETKNTLGFVPKHGNLLKKTNNKTTS